MKRLVLSLLLIVLSDLPASAGDRYFSLEAGTWAPHRTSTVDSSFHPIEVDYSTGWGLGSTLGASLDNGLRLEWELIYHQADAKRNNGNMWNIASLMNFWWDGRNSTRFTPYFGGGFGAGHARIASPGPIDESGYGIAYQAGGGLEVRIDKTLSADLGYRYFGIADTSNSKGIGSISHEGAVFQTGLRVKF